MRVSLLPVYSRLADPALLPKEIADRLPAGWQLSQHQLETYKALRDVDVDVVINTAMTGDGKSLAGLLPLLVGKNTTLALFPTNELAQDQFRSSEAMLPQWGNHADDVVQVSGPILDDILDQSEHLSRGETLLRELQNHPLVLSNPDMLHAITQFFYQQRGRATTHVVEPLVMLFGQFTFDEFHSFDATQITAVLTALLFLYEITPLRFKTLFLSATPDPRLIAPLQDLGFGSRLKIIAPQREGWYAHGADPGSDWRQILRGATLTFVPGTAEEWMVRGVHDVLLPWFQQHGKGAKAAIIVNSVATALRLVDQLRSILPADIHVEPNTGLNGRSTRKRSYEADILVGTSTVDVGVDFRINLLIFESSSAETFMQRLGRLGRHNDYTDAHGQVHSFHAYQAIALVPPFVYERLTIDIEGQPAKLHEGDVLQRDMLGEIIASGTFRAPTQFQHYARLWGRFQPAKVMAMLSQKQNTNSFADVRECLNVRYKQLTGGSMQAAIRTWHGYRQSNEEPLVAEAQTFRGGALFPCAVLKPDEGEVLSYDLFWLLTHVRLEFLSKSAFQAAAKARGLAVRPAWLQRQRFCFRWLGLLEQRERIGVQLTPAASNWGEERHQTAQVLSGFTLYGSTQPLLADLENTLLNQEVVALLIPDFEPAEVRRKLFLTGNIPLLPYSNAAASDPRTGTIAFGRAALLLDSSLRYRKPSSGDTAMFC